MSTPLAFDWIKFNERVVGEDHGSLSDVINRPLKFVMTQSDYDTDDLFPGFMARYVGTSTPEGVVFAAKGHAFVDTSAQKLHIKTTNIDLATGWMEIQAVPSVIGNYFSNSIYVGNVNANSRASLGVTIDQGANDDEILTFKSSDVAHGMTLDSVTHLTETNTFGYIKKHAAAAGGLRIFGFTETSCGIFIKANVTSQVTDRVAGNFPLTFDTAVKSGSSTVGQNSSEPANNAFAFRTSDFADSSINVLFCGDAAGNTYTKKRSYIGKGASNDIISVENTKQSVGLTVDQHAADDEAVSLKSSFDIAHGMTTLTETDTYFAISKRDALSGGALVSGFTEGGVGLQFVSRITVTEIIKTTAARGAIVLDGSLKTGTTAGSMGANTNVLSISDGGTTRFILDSDGDSHQDVGTAWTNFDTHDDIELMNKLSAHVTRHDDPLKESFGSWLDSAKEELEELELVAFNENGHHFVNMSRLQMLAVGAIRQLGSKINVIEERLKLLPA
jgi:hypothetical protein